MKLHWSSASPFVRKVMICAHELGVSDQIECVRSPVGPARLNAELMLDNPLNKLPTLVRDDGQTFFDSRVICEFLDHLAGGGRLFPKDAEARWRALRWQCLADGLCDVAILRRDEDWRGDGHRSTAHMSAMTQKIDATLDQMEKEAGALSETALSIGHVAVGVATSYLDFRPVGGDWRDGRPALDAWEATFAQRESAKSSPFVDARKKPLSVYQME